MQTLESKKIEDYLYLYLGCDVFFDRTTWEMAGITPEHILLRHRVRKDDLGLLSRVKVIVSEIQVILRPLDGMTEEEREKFGWQDKAEFEYLADNHQVLKNYYYGWQFLELLKLNFDLFGLIPAGLAIDKPQKQ